MSAIFLPSWYATQLTSIVAVPARERVHRDCAFVVACPQPRRPIGGVRQAAGDETGGVVERSHCAKREGTQHGVGTITPPEVREQGRDQRTVHDESRISLD